MARKTYNTGIDLETSGAPIVEKVNKGETPEELKAKNLKPGQGAGGSVNFQNKNVEDALVTGKAVMQPEAKVLTTTTGVPVENLNVMNKYDLGPATKVGATPDLARTTLKGVADVNADAISPEAQTAQSRLLALLTAAAEGKGPSAAQAQLQAGTEATTRAALAQAASSRGNQAAAARSAINAGALANQQQAQQSAMLRAQEMQAAYGLMGDTAKTMYQQKAAVELENMKKNLDFNIAQGNISAAEAQNIFDAANKKAMADAQLASEYQGRTLDKYLAEEGLRNDRERIKMESILGLESRAIDREKNRETRTAREQANQKDWLRAISGGLAGGATTGVASGIASGLKG